MSKLKGQHEVITTLLITGVLIGVVGSILFWGMPLIQKSKDASVLESSEEFMKTLSSKIKFIANNGGRDQLVITIPGTIKFLPNDPAGPRVQLIVDTQGTIYATEAEIPLGRNECSRIEGTWAVNEPEVLCLTSRELGTNSYVTTYRLNYILLRTEGVVSYQIVLTGSDATAGQGHTLYLENTGTQQTENLINTVVSIDIV